MPLDVKVLRIGEMIYRPKGTFTRRALHAVIAISLRLFFRRIESVNASEVPLDKPLVFVLNHPNGLIDPALIFVALPRRISFLAKSTLFRLPVIGFMLRTLEVLPLYRRADAGENLANNQKTFEACFELLQRNRCIAIFPEGVSHNSPGLLPLKTGAARISLGALAVGRENARQIDLKIVPVGLFYTSKSSFRSEALMRFGELLEVEKLTLDSDGEPSREAVRELTAQIETALREVTVNAESEAQLDIAAKAEQLFSSLSAGYNIEIPLVERVDYLRRFVASRLTENAAQGAERLENFKTRLLNYDRELRALNLAPENLSLKPENLWFVMRHFVLRLALLALLLPFTIPGAVLHLPAFLLCLLLARLVPKHGVDDITPTVKILAAMALMPLTWLVVALVFYFYANWQIALASLPLTILCGYVAMRSLEELADLRGWFKAAWLLVRRRQLFLRLLLERKYLQDELEKL